MMRCAVVEDEPISMRRLVRILEELGCEVVVRANSVDEAIRSINLERPEVLFLDIKLGDENAFEILKNIDYDPKVVFITAYDEYAVKAFEKEAIDYILKPFTKERIEKSLKRVEKIVTSERILEILKDLERKRLTVRDGYDVVLIDIDEIIYAEAREKNVFIVTKEGEFRYDGSLSDLESRLGKDFFRIHKSYVVNLSKVKRIKRWIGGHAVEMVNGSILPVSRKVWRSFKEKMGL